MLRLQETKSGLAEAALGEGGKIKLHKLSVKEVKAVRYTPKLSVLLRISYHHSCLGSVETRTQIRIVCHSKQDPGILHYVQLFSIIILSHRGTASIGGCVV